MESNPYKPPESEVTDLEDPPPALERPFNVTWGVRLLWANLIAGVPTFLELFGHGGVDMNETTRLFISILRVIVIGTCVVVAWLNVMTWRGRNWARITHLVLFGFSLLTSLFTFPSLLRGPGYEAMVYLLQLAMNGAGIGLLFTPSASAWYRSLRRR